MSWTADIFKKIMVILVITFVIATCIRTFTVFHIFIRPQSVNEGRGVIVTLMRSTNRSIHLTINMIHSVMYFHSINDNSSYPFLIFHDQNFTQQMQQYILSCTTKYYKQINISFTFINLTSTVQPSNTSDLRKSIGYRRMCRFWTYDVFYHPAVRNGGYDYLMRMDDDSYFSGPTKMDLFVYMKRKKLDYAFRATYMESNAPIVPVVQRLFHDVNIVTSCIYNNFFMIHLKWYYESERIQTFIHELVKDDLILREYMGDGCIHAAMLSIDKNITTEHIRNISYSHNFHVMPANRGSWAFIEVKNFYDEINKSCQQLTVLNGTKGELIQIKME